MKKYLLLSLMGGFLLVLGLLLYSGKLSLLLEHQAFDSDPQSVILSIDMHYPGIPKPVLNANDRYCPSIPYLRVWGDNLAMVNDSIEQVMVDKIQIGYLKNSTRTDLFTYLLKTGFMGLNVAKTPPNPAGTWMVVGIKLKSKPALVKQGDIGFIDYRPMLALIQPDVSAVFNPSTMDPRIEEILKKYENCNNY